MTAQLNGAEKRLAMAKGDNRVKLVELLRQTPKRLPSQRCAEQMQEMAKTLLPHFHVEPPKQGIPETLAASAKLVEAEIR